MTLEPYTKRHAYKHTLIRYGGYTGSPGGGNRVYEASFIDATSQLSGYRNPSWRSQLSQHTSATTFCSGSSVVVQPGYLYATARRSDFYAGEWHDDPDFYQSYGPFLNTNVGSFIPLPTGSVDNDALTRFYLDCSSKLTQAKGMTFLGELREAVHQIRHPFSALRNLLVKREVKLKKRIAGRHVSLLKGPKLLDFKNAIADTWLEVQYGLKPTVSDIDSFLQFLQYRHAQLGVEYYPVKGIARTSAVHTSSGYIECGTTAAAVGYIDKTTDSCKVRYKGVLKVDPLKPEVNWRDFQALGLSLREFGPTVWEVTPWSFLVDYVTNIGNVIESYNVPRENICWICKTARSESNTVRNVSGGFQNTIAPYFKVQALYTRASPAYVRRTAFQRTSILPQLLPRPSISFDLPSFGHIVNMFALALSNSRSRFSSSH